MIVFYLGTPEPDVLERISSDLAKRWILSCGNKSALPWASILPHAGRKAQDFAARLLQVPYSAE